MAMRKAYDYDQSGLAFAESPDGICQALSVRWMAHRAGQRGGAPAVQGAAWTGSRTELADHVNRIYGATRAARAALEREERQAMLDVIARFRAGKAAALAAHQREWRRGARLPAAAVAAAAAAAPGDDGAYVPPGFSDADLDARLAAVPQPRVMERVLDALTVQIQAETGLAGYNRIHADVTATDAPVKVCMLGAGLNLIDIRSARLPSPHAIAAEIGPAQTRLFDPNHGEWVSEPIDRNPLQPFCTLLSYLLSAVYDCPTIDYVNVVHMKF